ncbi:MAG: DUF1269 domain-containing protein [Methanomassiliicoccus sp.]|nr:DUF1269 domain-containing protein [Methanomassiliicoccus sp.]
MAKKEEPMTIVVARYDDLTGGTRSWEGLRMIRKEQSRGERMEIRDAAVLTKTADGELKVRETKDFGAGKGFITGAVVGGIIGIAAGPVGWAALGVGILGALGAELRNKGFDEHRIKTMASEMKPNSSAIIVLVADQWVPEVKEEIGKQATDVWTQGLSGDVIQHMEAKGDVTLPPEATAEPAKVAPRI